MAAISEKIRMMSTAGTGHYYTTTINKRNRTAKGQGKLQLRKYDPKARKHVLYKETKVK